MSKPLAKKCRGRVYAAYSLPAILRVATSERVSNGGRRRLIRVSALGRAVNTSHMSVTSLLLRFWELVLE